MYRDFTFPKNQLTTALISLPSERNQWEVGSNSPASLQWCHLWSTQQIQEFGPADT